MRQTIQMAQTPAATVNSRTGLLQRKCACGGESGMQGECTQCTGDKLRLQRFATHAGAGWVSPTMAPAVLRMAGRPLDSQTRGFMESRFTGHAGRVHSLETRRTAQESLDVGAVNDAYEQEADQVASDVMGSTERPRTPPLFDFSRVRVHDDSRANASAREVGALAYTARNHIVFGAGQYRPESGSGRRLLAHELTHTIQQGQGGSPANLQRACDTSTLSAKTKPIFFPHERGILRVFSGARTISSGSSAYAAVGLIQQGLSDLWYDLGDGGPNGDGVDKDFAGATEDAVREFQADHSLSSANPGVVDQITLKCLDQMLSEESLPKSFQIGAQRNGERAEDIFFERGLAELDDEDRAKIESLAKEHQGCPLTLKGFISEDELLEFGPQLAADRLRVVNAHFDAADHGDPSRRCPDPPDPQDPTVAPLRDLQEAPAASGGVGVYRSRRKVEVIPAGGAGATATCGKGAVQQRALDAAEASIVASAVDDAVALVDKTLGRLVPGDSEADGALANFFGGVTQRDKVRSKLRTWRRHIDRVVRRRSQRGTDCDAGCSGSIAYNNGVGGRAKMTVCTLFFSQDFRDYSDLSVAENRALLIVHEAGHGSLDTDDIAYDFGRLIHFIGRTPALALKNTDSFVTLIRVLTGLVGSIPERILRALFGISWSSALTETPDTTVGMDATEVDKAKEGIAWLDTWLTWAEQDASGVYDTMNESRTKGKWTNSYYSDWVLNLLEDAFYLARPKDALPTMGEQTLIAGIWDRFRMMSMIVGSDLEFEKDTKSSARDRWERGQGSVVPGGKVHLTSHYFNLATPRERVETLLPLIITATPSISSFQRYSYESFVKKTVRENWDDAP